jgi:hypothetical protein
MVPVISKSLSANVDLPCYKFEVGGVCERVGLLAGTEKELRRLGMGLASI